MQKQNNTNCKRIKPFKIGFTIYLQGYIFGIAF